MAQGARHIRAVVAAHPRRNPDAVHRLLAAGQTSVVDRATEHLQSLTADCPTDGQSAAVRWVIRECGAGIREVTMRCATDFVAPAQTHYPS